MSSPLAADYRRCCICFDNYTENQRAPVAIPCGHTFCRVCVARICFNNVISCSICRKVSFFGPRELGKNISLLKLLEEMKLLDPEGRSRTNTGPSCNRVPENAMDELDPEDILKFTKSYFHFLEQYCERIPDKLAMDITLTDNTQETELAARLAQSFDNCRELTRTLESVYEKTKSIFTSFNPATAQRIPDYNERVWIPVHAFERDDPFDLQASRTQRNTQQFISPPAWDDMPPIEINEDHDQDAFVPGIWNPASSLFQLIQPNHHRRYHR